MVLVLIVPTRSPPLLGSDPEGSRCRGGSAGVPSVTGPRGRPPMLAAARLLGSPDALFRCCGIITAHYEQVTEQMQIVILAAGMGTRLGRPLPKPLTVLDNGQTIIGRQV